MKLHLNAIKIAFVNETRPDHFTDFTHCCECAEHDETLRMHTQESIGLHELGNAGWDPICFINLEGFMYYFPKLAELAIGQGEEYYLDQFVFHLNSQRIEHFNDEQKRVVLNFLRHLREEFLVELSIETPTRFDLNRIIEALETTLE